EKAFQLDPEILDRILADLTARGLAVDAVDFQGHGEPLLNPRLWEMGRRSRAATESAALGDGTAIPRTASGGVDLRDDQRDGTVSPGNGAIRLRRGHLLDRRRRSRDLRALSDSRRFRPDLAVPHGFRARRCLRRAAHPR